MLRPIRNDLIYAYKVWNIISPILWRMRPTQGHIYGKRASWDLNLDSLASQC
jgi:hypothetical protein